MIFFPGESKSNYLSYYGKSSIQTDESKYDESKLNESKVDESIDGELEEVKRVFQEGGVSAAQELMRKKLESWKDVKVKIGVTGDSGVGKSRFINPIRG